MRPGSEGVPARDNRPGIPVRRRGLARSQGQPHRAKAAKKCPKWAQVVSEATKVAATDLRERSTTMRRRSWFEGASHQGWMAESCREGCRCALAPSATQAGLGRLREHAFAGHSIQFPRMIFPEALTQQGFCTAKTACHSPLASMRSRCALTKHARPRIIPRRRRPRLVVPTCAARVPEASDPPTP
jgi:hypothetical protein